MKNSKKYWKIDNLDIIEGGRVQLIWQKMGLDRVLIELKRWYFWTPLFDIIGGWAGPAYLATSQLINYALYRRRHSAKYPSKNHNNKEMAFWCWSHWAFFSVFDQIQIQWSMGRPLGPKTQIRSQGMTNKVSDHQRDNLSLLQLSSHLFFLDPFCRQNGLSFWWEMR